MKKIILALLLTFLSLNGFSKTWTVVSSGMTFSPATITINYGDSVKFTIDASHNAVEVSQAVWNANGTTSNGGFSIPFGGGTVLPTKLAAGTHYYVCTPHVAFGMKGTIIVSAATGLEVTKNGSTFMVYPNPVVDQLNIQLNFAETTIVEVKLFDIQGKLTTTLLPKIPVLGPFSQSFDLPSSMIPGVYLVRLNAGTATSYRKVVVL